MNTAQRPVGDLLRDWRQRRRLSQMALALDADVSPRHVSFLETGRARPSRDMLLNLAERLEIPFRDRNALLVAGGFAPVYPERSLDDPALRLAKEAVHLVLKGHEPYPALAIDRQWTLVAANQMIGPLLTGVTAELLRPPINVLRLSLHPDGLAPRIENLPQWRAHLLARLRHQVEITADPKLTALLEELNGYPTGNDGKERPIRTQPASDVFIPFRLRTEHGLLSFFSTTTIFGTPVDVTLSELAMEAFFRPTNPLLLHFAALSRPLPRANVPSGVRTSNGIVPKPTAIEKRLCHDEGFQQRKPPCAQRRHKGRI